MGRCRSRLAMVARRRGERAVLRPRFMSSAAWLGALRRAALNLDQLRRYGAGSAPAPWDADGASGEREDRYPVRARFVLERRLPGRPAPRVRNSCKVCRAWCCRQTMHMTSLLGIYAIRNPSVIALATASGSAESRIRLISPLASTTYLR